MANKDENIKTFLFRMNLKDQEDKKVHGILQKLPKKVSATQFIKTAILDFYEKHSGGDPQSTAPATLSDIRSLLEDTLLSKQDEIREIEEIKKYLDAVPDRTEVEKIVQHELTGLRSDLFSYLAQQPTYFQPVVRGEKQPVSTPTTAVGKEPENDEVTGIDLSPDILAFVNSPC